jgi:hypothetical protein
LELVELRAVKAAHKVLGCIERAGFVHHVCGSKRASGASVRIGGEHRGPLEECACGRETAACLRARSRSVELGRDVFVGCRRRLRSMPRPAIPVALWVRRLRKRAVRQSPLARRRCRVHGGTKEWVAERAPFSNLEQTRDFGWICRLNAKTEA